MLEKFGDDKKLANTLNANMGSRSFWGSIIPYLQADKAALSPLLDHDNINVKYWVKNYINRQIEEELVEEEERNIGLP